MKFGCRSSTDAETAVLHGMIFNHHKEGHLIIYVLYCFCIDLRVYAGVRENCSGLQVVVMCIFKAMIPLVQIGMLVGLSIVIFGIIGVEFYSGVYHAACLNNETGLDN